MQKFIVQNIKVPITTSLDDVYAIAENRLMRFFSIKDINIIGIYKKSVDARKKDNIHFNFSILLEVYSDKSPKTEQLSKFDIKKYEETVLDIHTGSRKLDSRPIVVGFGPCGMFASLILAMNGYKPIVIERGASVEERYQKVDLFNKSQLLDENTNIQFGAGGAGTFSDGKLITRINDNKSTFVNKILFEMGAPESILYSARPHIGTDYLKNTVANIHNRIIELGGEIHYNTQFLSFKSNENGLYKIITSKGEFECGALILSIGHSARDTFDELRKKNVLLLPKAFSVGVRIEHLRKDIEYGLYGNQAGNPNLPSAEYNLSCHDENGRGIYTFCMCPGGEVVAATSTKNAIVTNGMSNYLRNGNNSNSALMVSVLPDDYGNNVDGAISFQEDIEKKAFSLSKSYYAPCQTVGSFISNKKNIPNRIAPTYMNGNVNFMDIHNVFPSFINESIEFGLKDFNKKIKGFACDDALLTAPETRTSSPIKIPRLDDFNVEGYDNLFVAGEGAGYAGGITSAAIDGINVAIKVINKYKPLI